MILSFSLQDSATTESMVAMGYMLSKILEDVSAKEASEAVAIELTNGFEVDLPNKSGRALYPETSYLNHSCVPNIAQSHKVIQNGPSTTATTTGCGNNNNNNFTEKNGRKEGEDYQCRYFLELRVQRPVQAGTELTIRYNSIFDVSYSFHHFLVLFFMVFLQISRKEGLGSFNLKDYKY